MNSQADEIRINGLEVFARHGVFPEENSLGQKFVVNVVLETDIRRAALSDDIHASVHYGEVSEFITGYMRDNTFKLIETVADRMSREILLRYSFLSAVRLEVVKPWAPIGLPVNSVSVAVTRRRTDAYISIGSNMGRRRKYLENSIESLKRSPYVEVLKVSDFIETKPYGKTDQEDFLNGVVQISTILSAHELLELLHDIEQAAGRERTEHWGPRTLDMDIVFFGSEIICDEDLTIPHADMQNRLFVLEPLSQLSPHLRHPVTGVTITEMKDALS